MTSPPTKLRFGVMCAGERLPSAFAASIGELLKVDGVELALLIVEVSPPASSPRRDKWRNLLSLNGTLWAIFQRLLSLRGLSCYRPRDMSAVFAGVPRILCRVTRKDPVTECFHPQDVERIRASGLAFILRFTGGMIGGDILTAARYGVWSFHHGDESKVGGGPPAFWEIYENEPTTGAVLRRLGDGLNRGIVLHECRIRTRRCSYADNLNAVVWAAAHLPARVCRDILAGCAPYLEAVPTGPPSSRLRVPTDLQMVRFLFKTWAAWARQQVESILLAEDWNVGIVRAPVRAFLKPDFRPGIQWLAGAKANTFRADPFVHSVAGEKRLLLEEFDHLADRGVIVEMELDEHGAAKSAARPAIDNGAHMSYPYLIEHKGQVYCIPESWQRGNVSVYALDGQERRWRAAGSIIADFPAVDPTVLQHDGLWWLWCTHAEEPDSTLFLWYAFDLFGPWLPHPGNPVKVDVRSSRPAGRPFLVDGDLYRPAQDCSRTYGGGITINRVTRLSPVEFCEAPVVHIEPWDRRYRTGIHTLAGDGALTVVDGKRMVVAPALVRRRLAHKMRRLAQVCRARSRAGRVAGV